MDKMFLENRRKALKAAIDEGRDIREFSEYIRREYIEDDTLVIHVNAEELYDPMCTEKFRLLNGSIFEYVEGCAKLIPAYVPIKVILFGVDEEDREAASRLFKQHYQAELQDVLREQRTNLAKTIFMGLIGLIAITLVLYFAISQDDNLFLELLSVVSSFALWEVANWFFVGRQEIKMSLYKTAQFLTAEIAFDE